MYQPNIVLRSLVRNIVSVLFGIVPLFLLFQPHCRNEYYGFGRCIITPVWSVTQVSSFYVMSFNLLLPHTKNPYRFYNTIYQQQEHNKVGRSRMIDDSSLFVVTSSMDGPITRQNSAVNDSSIDDDEPMVTGRQYSKMQYNASDEMRYTPYSNIAGIDKYEFVRNAVNQIKLPNIHVLMSIMNYR